MIWKGFKRGNNMEIGEFLAPKSITEAFELLQSPNSKVIGGGAWLKLSLKSIDKLISLEHLGLDYIIETNDGFEIGAMTTLRRIETEPGLKRLASGVLAVAIKSIMGVAVRNLATLGGSIMGKFAFSDLLGALLVLDAQLKFHELGEISLLDFLAMSKVPNDILLSIMIKKHSGEGYFHKVSKNHMDFAILNIAVCKTENFKIAIGSRPNHAILAIKTANYLNSLEEIDEDALDKAMIIALEEVKLGDNLRGSKEYREVLLKTYLKRGIKKVIL